MILIVKLSLVIFLGIPYTYGLGNGPVQMNWASFKEFHGKVYSSTWAEETAREVFERNAAAVISHNEAFKKGEVTYSKELNSFADMDSKEFEKRNGLRATNATQISRTISTRFIAENEDYTLPESFDWRDWNMVSPIKNQGQCGSCWAFSATGAMESQILISSSGQKRIILSEQQLIDCDNIDNGCNGGLYTNAWTYIQQNGGIESDQSYPYYSLHLLPRQ